jgi:hypothetical protein
LSSFILLCPTQGHPTKASGIHSIIYLQHGFKVLQQRSNFFCFHHSSTSTPHIIYLFLEQLAYFAESLVQWNSTTTSLVVHVPISQTANKKKITQREKLAYIALPFCFLSYLSPLIMQTYTMLQLPPPSIARCKSVSHNTQTNKTPNPSIPCNIDGIILVVNMQKVDDTENKQTKNETLKTCCAHIIIMTFCLITIQH